MKQLEENPYKYDFEVSLYDSAVQGRNVEADLMAAFNDINENVDSYDCVIIIRGGGSKLDLSAFDNYKIASTIAQCSLPVFTGIGHEIDETVSDMVAHSALKTPTAVASFIIDRCAYFEGEIHELSETIRLDVLQRIKDEDNKLKAIQQAINFAPKSILESEKLNLASMIRSLERGFRYLTSKESLFLTKAETLMKVVDPKHILKRGFTLVKQDGAIISSSKKINPKQRLQVSFSDGDIEAELIKK